MPKVCARKSTKPLDILPINEFGETYLKARYLRVVKPGLNEAYKHTFSSYWMYVVLVLHVSLRDWLSRIAWQSALLYRNPLMIQSSRPSRDFILCPISQGPRSSGWGWWLAPAATFSDGKIRFFFFDFGYPDLSLTTQTRFSNLTIQNTHEQRTDKLCLVAVANEFIDYV